MSNINQNKIYMVCACVLIVLVSVFVWAASRPENMGTKKEEIPSQSDITEGHFYKKYSESFIVDADVPSTFNDKAEVLFVKSGLACDEKKVCSVFFKENSPERSTYTSSGIEIVTYQYKDKFVSITPGTISYTSNQYQYVALPTDEFNTKSQYVNSFPRFNEIYKKDNLGFMTKTEAIKTVKGILNDLSIEVSDSVEAYAIDHETMQLQQEQRMQENPDIALMYQTKNKFTEKDDFYLLCFTVIMNEMPITPYDYMFQGGDRSVPGSEIKVYFSKDGIFYFVAKGLYLMKGVAESPNRLITLQEAIEKAFEIHKSIITTDKLLVEDVNFEYGFVPYNQNYNEIKLTPTWTLRLSYEVEGSYSKEGKSKKAINESKQTRIIAINAVTGEKIN